MKQDREPITNLNICEIVDEHTIPGFNVYNLKVLMPQIELAAEIANDPHYQELVETLINAMVEHNLKMIADTFNKKADYTQSKFGENKGFNAGIEQGAYYALIETSLAKSPFLLSDK